MSFIEELFKRAENEDWQAEALAMWRRRVKTERLIAEAAEWVVWRGRKPSDRPA